MSVHIRFMRFNELHVKELRDSELRGSELHVNELRDSD